MEDMASQKYDEVKRPTTSCRPLLIDAAAELGM